MLELGPSLGRYGVIVADPPWRYRGVTTSPSRRIERHYPTMDLEQIRALPVASVAADDAVLFLWSTSPLLPEAVGTIPAWGFSYKSSLVWDKQALGMGYWARIEHELLLLAVRGKPRPPLPAHRPRSVVHHPRLRHSEKPDVFLDLIETMFPHATKLELFARRARKGWTAWGDQVGNYIGE